MTASAHRWGLVLSAAELAGCLQLCVHRSRDTGHCRRDEASGRTTVPAQGLTEKRRLLVDILAAEAASPSRGGPGGHLRGSWPSETREQGLPEGRRAPASMMAVSPEKLPPYVGGEVAPARLCAGPTRSVKTPAAAASHLRGLSASLCNLPQAQEQPLGPSPVKWGSLQVFLRGLRGKGEIGAAGRSGQLPARGRCPRPSQQRRA